MVEMPDRTIFLTNPDEIKYFDGRFLVTAEEHTNYLAYKQRKQERKQLITKLRTYWRN